MSDNRRRDGSKPTFSERDKRQRERGSRRDRGRDDRGSERSQAHAQKAYRAALERAFESGKVDELVATLSRASDPRPPMVAPPPAASGSTTTSEPAASESTAASEPAGGKGKRAKPAPPRRNQLLAKIREAEGSAEITDAIDRFLGEFPALPRDYEVLEKALHHRKDDVVRTALEQIDAMLAQAKPRRNRSLLIKLALLAENHADEEICALAARIRPRV